jgi:WD40 repeat protein
VAFSPDGTKLASTGDDGRLKVWDPSTGRLLASRSAVGDVWGPSFSADGSLVAAAWLDEDTFKGTVRIVNLSADRVVSTLRMKQAVDTALSPNGKRIAVVSRSRAGAVFDVDTGEELYGLTEPNCCFVLVPRGVSWSPDGRYLAAGSAEVTRVWEAGTGRLRHRLSGHTGIVHNVAWSSDSSRLVSVSEDGTAKVWELGKGVRELWSLSARDTRAGIVGVAFSPDGTRVAAGDADITAVSIWDLGRDGDAEWVNVPAASPFQDFMPGGRRLVATSGNEGSALTIWDLNTGSKLRTIGPATDRFWFQSIDVSPDGGSIALGGGDLPDFGGDAVRVWDTTTGEELYRIRHELDVNDVSFSPDGKHLATASFDGKVKIVDRSGRVIRVLQDEGSYLEVMRFSPDGLLVAATAFRESGGKHVTIWDWVQGEVIRTIPADIFWMDFDPSGPRIAISVPQGRAEIWDVVNGTRVAVLTGHSGELTDIAYSPDGSSVATASHDGTVRLFEADTGEQQLVLRTPGCLVASVAFSPDGTKLSSTSPCYGGMVRIWALDIDDLLEIARREVTRPLTDEECRQYLHVDQCPRGPASTP